MDTGDEGCLVAVGALHEALAAGGEVVDDHRCKEAQPIKVNEVDVAALAGREPTAVVEAEKIGRFARSVTLPL